MNIPVEYEYRGQKYKGRLSQVSGSASTNFYHLYVNNFYHGQLQLLDRGWVFSNQEGWQPELADYFGDVITAWFE